MGTLDGRHKSRPRCAKLANKPQGSMVQTERSHVLDEDQAFHWRLWYGPGRYGHLLLVAVVTTPEHAVVSAADALPT